MKKNAVFTAAFVIFTIACFAVGLIFPDNDNLILQIWYVVMLAAWCVFAVKLLSLSFKLSKIKRSKREIKNRKENKK